MRKKALATANTKRNNDPDGNIKMKNTLLKVSKNILCIVLTALIIFPLFNIAVSAKTYSKTVNLSYVDRNEQGEGYFWDNREKVLTLNSINIDTDDDWGIRLPENATIVLKGTNKISAAKYALGCRGNVTIKGDGTLILESGEYAIYVHSRNSAHKFRVFEGNVTAKGEKAAFYSENAEFSMVGGKLDFSSNGEFTVDSRVFSVTGGKITVNGTIRTSHLLKIDEAEVIVNSDSVALKNENLFEYDNLKFMVGAKSTSLTESEKYSNEKCLKTVPVPPGPRDSIIFGEGTPITVDYILLVAGIILVSACIIIPILRKKNKTKKLYASLENDNNKKTK